MPLIYGEGKKAFVRLREAIDAPSVVQEQKLERHRIVTNWISSIDFAAQQTVVISRRQDGTGVWFVDSTEFQNWLNGSNQTLFCPGIPGAGKTMITAIAVDHIWNYVQDKDVGLAYIYCNYKTQADQTAIKLAAVILKQLIQERPSIAEPVANLYNRHADRRTHPSLQEIRSALQIVVSDYSKVYVIVDALDECLMGHRIQLLAMLRDLQSNRNVSFMTTSRFIPEVVQQFTLSPTLEIRANDSDVKRFVTGQIYRLPGFVQRNGELQVAIKDGISAAVDGMFLLARLHVDSLLDKNTKKKIMSTLDALPKGTKALDAAYEDAIERIEGQLSGKRMLAKSVMSWISYAQRPLTTGELCHAVAVEPGESELDPDNIPDVEDIVSVCAGLVTVDDEGNIIRLVHYTTQEYFERIRESWNLRAQQEIASVCLTYLSFNPFRSGSCLSNEDFESRLQKNGFLDYTSRFWGQHVQTIQEQVYDLASRFLQDANLVSCAVQAMSMSVSHWGDYSQHSPRKVTGLHLTAGFGLLYMSERLLSDTGRNIEDLADLEDDRGRTPLLLAAMQGHDAVVKLLLETGAVHLDSKDVDGWTPLSQAAEQGHDAVVKLLLETGAVDLDSKDGDDRTPLFLAAKQGHEAVVKLLLEAGATDLDSKDRWGQTPLSRAAMQGHDAVVKLLLETGAVDLDSKDSDDRTPLSLAAKQGHEAVVKLLLEAGATDLDSKDRWGQTPLSRAAMQGHDAVVKLLLEAGATDLDSKDRWGQTPLSRAAMQGHDAVVKLLLETGAVDLDSKDNWHRTPLSLAAMDGHDAVVRLLLETGAVDLDSKDGDDRTPLSLAAEQGHEAVVKLLLETGAVDLDSKDGRGQTPLS